MGPDAIWAHERPRNISACGRHRPIRFSLEDVTCVLGRHQHLLQDL
jgi:hypothetical protein